LNDYFCYVNFKDQLRFLAIDFETASHKRDSACAVGLAIVEDNKIKESGSFLIKPPSRWFMFTHIHGITWNDVVNEPDFGELWPAIKPIFNNIDFAVAHNSSFDEGVLRTCCQTYNIQMPEIKFKCTMNISRSLWGIYPTKLPDVCQRFGIELNHHNALSDTLACAQIMIKAMESGYTL
jgi:DNA polymerase III subunit epsilon